MKSTSVGLTKVTGGRRVHDLEINQQELHYLRERKKINRTSLIFEQYLKTNRDAIRASDRKRSQ